MSAILVKDSMKLVHIVLESDESLAEENPLALCGERVYELEDNWYWWEVNVLSPSFSAVCSDEEFCTPCKLLAVIFGARKENPNEDREV